MSAATRTVATQALVVTGVAAAVVTTLLFVWFARDVLLLLFAGVLLAVFLRRLSQIIHRVTGLSLGVSLTSVVLVLTGVLVAVFWLQGGTIADEASRLREELPRALEQLRGRVADTQMGARVVEQLPREPSDMLPDAPDAISRATGVVSRTFSGLASALIILFLGLVLAGGPGPYIRGFLALFPEDRTPRMQEVLNRMADTLWWWLLGRLLSMTFIGVITWIGLLLLGVPLAFVLGLLAALLSFIPNIGPILSAAPALLLALMEGPRTALWVLALYGGVQVVESYLLAPIIDRRTVYLPPALTVAAQLLMALFGGLLGVTLATPLLAATVVVVTMLYVQDTLGRRDIGVAAH